MHFAKALSLSVFFVVLLIPAHQTSASAIGEPLCTVTGKVTEIIPEERSFTVRITRAGGLLGPFCWLRIGQIHTLEERWYGERPPGFDVKEIQLGDRLRGGITTGSSMGEAGAVSWVHWSDVRPISVYDRLLYDLLSVSYLLIFLGIPYLSYRWITRKRK